MLLKRSFNAVRIFLIFLVLVWAAGCAGHLSQGTPPEPIPLTILFFNDPHGHLMPFEIKSGDKKEEVGGIARMAAVIRDIRAENSRKNGRTLLLVAGDLLQGTPMSTVFRGEPDVECLNAMGVDAVTVGNHEFDFGLENFRKLQGKAAFPFLSANVVEKASGRPLCKAFRTIPLRDGLEVTVIGVTTEELLTTTLPAYVAALDVKEAVSSVRQVYDRVRSRGPVVLLSHSGYRMDREIAGALPDLAAVIGGHDHILLSPYPTVGRVPIFQAFEKGRILGRIDLRVDPVSRKADLVGHAYIPITDKIEPEPRVAAIVAGYQDQLGDRFKEVIGHADVFLDGERGHIRNRETTLGNFVADIMMSHTGAQMALINSGAIRASIRQGPITLEDVFKTVPFPNELMTMALAGAEIEQALLRSVSRTPADADGGFLQVSGITFDVRGRSVENVRVGKDRQPLQPKTVYKVAITDFLATGGDSYMVFKGKDHIQTGLPLQELLVDTIRRLGVIRASEEGRIRRLE